MYTYIFVIWAQYLRQLQIVTLGNTIYLLNVFDLDVYVSFVLEIKRHSLSDLNHEQSDRNGHCNAPYYSEIMKQITYK